MGYTSHFALTCLIIMTVNFIHYTQLQLQPVINPEDFRHYFQGPLKIYPDVSGEYRGTNGIVPQNTLVHKIEEDITAIAMLTPDRLSRLASLARRWSGPISFVLYLKTEHSVAMYSPKSILDRLHRKFPFIFERQNMQMHVVVAAHSYKKFPMNELRNISWKYVKTPLIFILDVDFIPSKNLNIQLSRISPEIWGRLRRKYLVLVVPAWDYGCTDGYNEETCELVSPTLGNHDSQRASDVSRWLSAEEAYQVQYSMYYEPYFIASVDIPIYDESFTIGHDKTEHTYELVANGYEFWILPKAYIAHIPHPPSVAHSLNNDYYDYDLAWSQWIKFVRRIYRSTGYHFYCDGEQLVNHGNPFIRLIRKFICFI
jgi:hypothetical protein